MATFFLAAFIGIVCTGILCLFDDGIFYFGIAASLIPYVNILWAVCAGLMAAIAVVLAIVFVLAGALEAFGDFIKSFFKKPKRR